MTKTTTISVVSPVYRAEKIVIELVARLQKVLLELGQPYEIILVEDGSPDDSWKTIVDIAKKYSLVKGIKLSRNFGQHNALNAGLQAAIGDVIIVIDCDLQDNPDYIPVLYAKMQEGYDLVFTHSPQLQHSLIRRLESKLYNFTLKYLSDYKGFEQHVNNYSLLTRKVVDAFLQLKDVERQYLMVLRWLGFKYAFVEVQHEARFEGQSSYTFSKLIELAITGLTYQAVKLLYIPFFIGIFLFCIANLWGITLVITHFLAFEVAKLSFLFVTLFWCTGLIITCIGLLGIYLNKIFSQVRNRPHYLIEERVGY